MYFNTNMFAPLPAQLANNGKADTLLTIVGADDLATEAKYVARISVRILSSDRAVEVLSDNMRLVPVTVTAFSHPEGGGRGHSNYPSADLPRLPQCILTTALRLS